MNYKKESKSWVDWTHGLSANKRLKRFCTKMYVNTAYINVYCIIFSNGHGIQMSQSSMLGNHLLWRFRAASILDADIPKLFRDDFSNNCMQLSRRIQCRIYYMNQHFFYSKIIKMRSCMIHVFNIDGKQKF